MKTISFRVDSPGVRSLATVILAAGFLLVWAGASARAGSQVIAWGAGTTITPADGEDYGQSIIPARLTNAVSVAGGEWHSLALTAAGTLTGWGDDSFGQTDFPAGSNYVAVACGSLHSLALRSDGSVVAAGDDFYGQTDVPVALSNVVAIACGFYHSLALKSDGTVVAWGAGTGSNPNVDFGQNLVPPGLSNVVQIAAGGYHSLALKSDGTVAEWGDDSLPSTGISNVTAIATGAEHEVALNRDGTLTLWGSDQYGQREAPAGLSNVVAIAAGGWHTLALKSNGTVVAWGAGTGSNANVDYGQNLVPVGLSNVVEVAAGQLHSLVLVGNGPPPGLGPLTVTGFGANGFTLALPARNGRVYRLEYKNSLTDSTWIPLPLQRGTGGELPLTDPAPVSPMRFYRASHW